jgi:malate synthase
MAVTGVEIKGPVEGRGEEFLSDEALELVALLHRELEDTRQELLARRAERQGELDEGGSLDFDPETQDVREGDWEVAPPAPALTDRRVEITGPTSRKMVVNALNSGARGFMADFEDANSPTWQNMVDGQANLYDAIRRQIDFTQEDGREYALVDDPATLLIRPRGWHLDERHVEVDGTPVAGGLFDFALYFTHNAEELLDRGSGVFLYLPKMEHHREARMWNRAFELAEDHLGVDRGTVRGTVLIETLPAAFQMDEILYELREHSAGLNAGRWDYIFSAIKRFRGREDMVLPDRVQVTMTVPFMHAYTELLVRTCHRRGAHAMGGMAAQIPSRTDEEAAERAREAIAADKKREAEAGFDGTWVAHPDSVETALEAFDAVLGDKPNQIDKKREDVSVSAADLLAIGDTPGEITEAGLRSNVNVGIQYISSWLRGNGAAAIYGLMEDAATAEISRSQIWQWVHHGVQLEDGRPVTPELVRDLATDELEKIREEIGDDEWFEREGRPAESREIFEQVALADEFVEFLTIPAYAKLQEIEAARP